MLTSRIAAVEEQLSMNTQQRAYDTVELHQLAEQQEKEADVAKSKLLEDLQEEQRASRQTHRVINEELEQLKYTQNIDLNLMQTKLKSLQKRQEQMEADMVIVQPKHKAGLPIFPSIARQLLVIQEEQAWTSIERLFQQENWSRLQQSSQKMLQRLKQARCGLLRETSKVNTKLGEMQSRIEQMEVGGGVDTQSTE